MAFDSIKSGVDYLANQFISPIARDNKLLLTAAVLTYIAYEKLVPLSQETQQFTKLGTPNQKYFPQYIENKQGMWLYTTEWKAVNVNQPKGIIFICHGLAEHIHRYEPIGRYFQSHGFTVLGIDHQGHGQSQGIRTYVEKWQDYVDDYIQFIRENQRKAEYQNIPAFLLGHSMGGNIATQVMRQTFNNSSGTGVKLQGLILSAPAVWLDPAMAPPLKVKIGGFISKYLPRMVVAKLPLDTLSSIQQVKDQYNDDILVTHGGMQARWSSEIAATMADIEAHYDEMIFPFLLLHGSADRIVPIEGSQKFFDNAPSKDKQLIIQEGSGHEMHNDSQSDKFVTDIEQWINNHITKGTSATSTQSATTRR